MIDLAYRMNGNYENRQRFYLTRRTPVIIRVDGRAFHTLTARCEKPFDEHFIKAMRDAAEEVAEQMQGCKLAFVQSDEASFLLIDYDNLQTEAWFDYNLQKIVSIAAAEMTASFYYHFNERGTFDARAFNIPREEVANYFLWRAKDWHRNSVQMYARSFFPDSQLLGKKIADIHEMLHSLGSCDIPKNWTTDLSEHLRNGWWYSDGRWRSDILPSFESINAVVEPFVAEKQEIAVLELGIPDVPNIGGQTK